VQVFDPPSEFDDDELIFGVLLNLSIKILFWIFGSELFALCQFLLDLFDPAFLLQHLLRAVGLIGDKVGLRLVSLHLGDKCD
jgi:hypothetical protein